MKFLSLVSVEVDTQLVTFLEFVSRL